jgi:hypothetical protein
MSAFARSRAGVSGRWVVVMGRAGYTRLASGSTTHWRPVPRTA